MIERVCNMSTVTGCYLAEARITSVCDRYREVIGMAIYEKHTDGYSDRP